MLNLCMEMQRISARRVASRRVRFGNRLTHVRRLAANARVWPRMRPCDRPAERRNRAKPGSRQPSPPCDRDARGTGVPGELHAHAVCQPGRAEGRASGARRARNFRQPEPDDRPRRHPAADPRARGRKPDGARQRRAVHAVRIARRKRRDRRCAQLRHVPHQPEGAIFRRQAGDGRGCAVLARALAHQRPAQPPPVLLQDRQGRSARSAHRALRPHRRQRPRAAADPRPDADPAEARHRRGDVRRDVDDAADRHRPLSHRPRQAGLQHRVRAQSRLLGPRPADQSRPVEFRRDPLRVLSRRERGVRSIQTRPL